MNFPATLTELLPQGLADARILCGRAAARALKTEEQLTVSAWADRYRKLSSKASESAGQWRTAFTPYLREIMDAQSVHHPGTESAFMKGTQIGGSECAYNAVGYWTDQSPGPGLIVMPTREMAASVSSQRLQPMFDDAEPLRGKVAESRSRDAGNSTFAKHYPGGIWYLRGANSAAGLGSNPIRYLVLDEVDKYQASVGEEGDPVQLAKKRTSNFRRRKIFEVSSPKLKATSRIAARFEAGSQGRYHVACPHCAHEQALRWEQMRWKLRQRRELVCCECGAISSIALQAAGRQRCPECQASVELGEATARIADTDEIERVWYECESCSGEIEEHHKTRMLEEGRYIHAAPGPGEFVDDGEASPWAIWVRAGQAVRRFLPTFERPLSWHVSALYSPIGWFSWRHAVRQYLEAKKGGVDVESGEPLLQVFENTVLGEPHDPPGEQPDDSPLKLRAEPYRCGQVPKGALLLTAAVDVQGNRIEVKVKGWGRFEESWLVDYQVINGDPSILGPGSVWSELERLLDKGYPHAGGATLRIMSMAIDSGGHHTQEVYLFASKWAARYVFAVKGASKPGRPVLSTQPSRVDINYRGKSIKNGAELWMVGSDTGKAMVYRRLKLEKPGPGYMHFPAGLPDEYYAGLTAEKMITRSVKGFARTEWVKERANEPLDLEVYAYAAAVRAGIQRTNWDRLEAVINPKQADIFAPAGAIVVEPPAPATEAAPVPDAMPARPMPRPASSNWVTGFRT